MSNTPLESAGGVVLAHPCDGRRYVALVRRRDGGLVLPKGRREAGETLEDTALREVHEETSLDSAGLSIRFYIGSYDLNEHAPDSGVRKINHFFLMEWAGAQLPPLASDPDHGGAEWHVLPLQGVALIYPAQAELLTTCLGALP